MWHTAISLVPLARFFTSYGNTLSWATSPASGVFSCSNTCYFCLPLSGRLLCNKYVYVSWYYLFTGSFRLREHAILSPERVSTRRLSSESANADSVSSLTVFWLWYEIHINYIKFYINNKLNCFLSLWLWLGGSYRGSWAKHKTQYDTESKRKALMLLLRPPFL